MTTPLDECRAAAPAWMADGWRDFHEFAVWGDAAGVEPLVCVWDAPRAGEDATIELVIRNVRIVRAVVPRRRLSPALAYVAGEVRAEMVARGLVSEAEPAGPAIGSRWSEGTGNYRLRTVEVVAVDGERVQIRTLTDYRGKPVETQRTSWADRARFGKRSGYVEVQS